jgi:hypothetical protein
MDVEITITVFAGSELGIGGAAALLPMLTIFSKPAIVDISLTLHDKAYDLRLEEGVEEP